MAVHTLQAYPEIIDARTDKLVQNDQHPINLCYKIWNTYGDISVTSALEVNFNNMRYINLHFTYLLTYLDNHSEPEFEVYGQTGYLCGCATPWSPCQ